MEATIIFCCFSVDPGSLAEEAGFRVGDQILNVNGKNFENIKHKEAVEFIKNNKHIIVTLKVRMNKWLFVIVNFSVVILSIIIIL